MAAKHAHNKRALQVLDNLWGGAGGCAPSENVPLRDILSKQSTKPITPCFVLLPSKQWMEIVAWAADVSCGDTHRRLQISFSCRTTKLLWCIPSHILRAGLLI